MLSNTRDMNNNALTPTKVSAIERHAQAVEMRIAGRTFSQIAVALGYADESCAWRAVKSALDQMLPAPCEHLRSLLTARLERTWAELYPRFLKATADPEKELSETSLKLVDRMVKITLAHGKLAGLDRQGVLVQGVEEDDMGQSEAPAAPQSPPKSREEQLRVLLERLQARQANAATVVTQVVDHVDGPGEYPSAPGEGSNGHTGAIL